MKNWKKIVTFMLSLVLLFETSMSIQASQTGVDENYAEESLTEEEQGEGDNEEEQSEDEADTSDDEQVSVPEDGEDDSSEENEEDVELLEYIKAAQDALNVVAGEETLMAIVYLCENYSLKESPGLESGSVAKLPSGATVFIKGFEVDEDFNLWYQVTAEQSGSNYTGYIEREYLAYSNELFLEWEDTYFPKIAMFAAGSEFYPDVEQFPASYQDKLMRLKQEHPNWIFVKQNTGLEWQKVVSAENYKDRNLISQTMGEAYRGDYYGQGWYYASEAAVKYYLDPRNFLDDTRVFQFEQLTYNPSYHSKAAVQNILSKTFMSGQLPKSDMTYADAFFKIGVSLKVSPFHLACRVYQEQGKGTSQLISGTYDVVPEYKGYYNYFNIGASGTTDKQVIETGLARARKEGWNTPYASLNGGAGILSVNYILRGQDTLYLQKFDVDASDGTLYTHQYMQNIMAPYTESAMVKQAYIKTGALDSPFVFKIPVYNNMPQTACPVPSQVAPTAKPTEEPTAKPTEVPTAKPTEAPTAEPTAKPTEVPTAKPTEVPTAGPTAKPTEAPTAKPTAKPTEISTAKPTKEPTAKPTEAPTAEPTTKPTEVPTAKPTEVPTAKPTEAPTAEPTTKPTEVPTAKPTEVPTAKPTEVPTAKPTEKPTEKPTAKPTEVPTAKPTETPTVKSTVAPTATAKPTTIVAPTATAVPTVAPTATPTQVPSPVPTKAVSETNTVVESSSSDTDSGNRLDTTPQSKPTASPEPTTVINGSDSDKAENRSEPSSVNVTQNTNSAGVTVTAATPIPYTESAEKKTVSMDMSKTGTIYAQTLQQLKEQEMEVELKVSEQASWFIDGSTIESEGLGDINLGVTFGESRIPEEKLAVLTENEKYVEMSLAHEGEFGFPIVLSIMLEDAQPGQYANLFYYNEIEGDFEFMCAAIVGNMGRVNFEFSHASDYVIIISGEMKESLLQQKAKALEEVKAREQEAIAQAKEELPAKEPGKAAAFIALILLGSVAIGIAIYLVIKRKDES